MHHHARGLEATRDTAWALDGAGRAAARPPQRAREHDLPAVPLAARGRAGPHLRAGPGSLPRGRPSRLPYGRRGQGLRRHAAGGQPPRRPPGAEGLRHARARPGRPPRLRARGDARGRRARGRAPADAAARPRVGAGADVRGHPHARRARARGARGGVAGGRGGMRRALALGGVLVSLYTTAGCSDRASGTQRAAAPPAVPILAAEAVRKDVPLDVGVIGTVQALTTVGVKAQVAGQVVKVHFTEGQDVKAGQLLFTIDPRPFEATVAQAEANVGRDTAQMRQAEAALAQRRAEVQQALANLERDQAQLENARVQERRYKTLVEKELVARELYDQFRTNLSALEATLNADRAAVENARAAAQAAQAGVENARAVIQADEAMVETARLNVGYTTLRAPMDGRTGNLMLQAGNIVKANDDNPMVVIAQVHPIYVSFAVPQQHLAAIKQYSAAGPLSVRATPPGSAKPAVGRLTFVNNTVDPTTGTIQLKATLKNAENGRWPGQYAEGVLTLTSESAVVVPSQDVHPGQQGPDVFVVQPDLTVQPRPADPGRRLATETLVTRGVETGDVL